MDYLPTFGEKWPHSRGNGLVNIPYMDPMGLSCSFYGVCVCVCEIDPPTGRHPRHCQR